MFLILIHSTCRLEWSNKLAISKLLCKICTTFGIIHTKARARYCCFISDNMEHQRGQISEFLSTVFLSTASSHQLCLLLSCKQLSKIFPNMSITNHPVLSESCLVVLLVLMKPKPEFQGSILLISSIAGIPQTTDFCRHPTFWLRSLQEAVDQQMVVWTENRLHYASSNRSARKEVKRSRELQYERPWLRVKDTSCEDACIWDSMLLPRARQARLLPAACVIFLELCNQTVPAT